MIDAIRTYTTQHKLTCHFVNILGLNHKQFKITFIIRKCFFRTLVIDENNSSNDKTKTSESNVQINN